MKTKTMSIIASAFLALAFTACNFSFGTANISSLSFGKNEAAKPSATTFNVGETIYAVATASNVGGKYKMKFSLKYENVAGKTKGESVFNDPSKTEVSLDSDSDSFINFTVDTPGEYKIEAVLVDDQGKEVDKKSGTVTVK